jgi:FkbM family methyltransferase
MLKERTAPAVWKSPMDTRFGRRMFHVRHLIICGLLLRRSFRLTSLGDKSTGCQWTFCPDGLGRESIIYSGGVGKDITFEHALVREYGCDIQLLDPSPTGLATMNRKENQIPQLHFHPVALSGHCGTLRFAKPIHEEEGSWYASSGASGTVEVACTDLGTLMKKNGHTRIDMLKLDIEGGELPVVDDILRKRIPVRQLLLEYHDGLLPGFTVTESLRSMARLTLRGYKLIARIGTTCSFINPRL